MVENLQELSSKERIKIEIERFEKFYNESIKRLNDYRFNLFSKMDKFEFPIEEIDKFRLQLKEDLLEAKKFLEDFRLRNKQLQSLPNNNQKLIADLLLKKRAKLVIELLHSTNESVREVKNLIEKIKNEYQRMNKGVLSENIKMLRKNFAQIMKTFNVLLLIEIKDESALFKNFYNYIEQNNSIIIELISEIFKWSFQFISWPLITLEDVFNFNNKKPSESDLNFFYLLLNFLLELQTGDYLTGTVAIKNNIVKNLPIFQNQNKQIYLPVKVLAEPMIKRFRYHFMNPDSKLNSAENPEWYLCQVEQWITRNEPFLIEHVDPHLLAHFGESFETSKYQLLCVLLGMIHRKLQFEEPNFKVNRLLTLTIDELIVFNKQMAIIQPDLYVKNPNFNPIKALLQNESLKKRLMRIQKKRVNAFIESIFESKTAWMLNYGGDGTEDGDKFKLCEAADKFTLLIKTLIDRSTFIPDKDFKEELINLIIEICDDFRLRLIQLIHDYEESWPFSQRFFSILNTFDFLLVFIREFSTNSVFIQFSDSDGFDEAELNQKSIAISNLCKTFEHLIEEIFERIGNVIILDFIFDLAEYKALKWHAMSVDLNNLQMSPEAVKLFFSVQTKLNLVKTFMSANLFEDFLLKITGKIQDMLLDQFILKTNFNKDGIAQLKFDFEKGLLIFQYSGQNKIEYKFAKIFECLNVFGFSLKTYRTLRQRYETDSAIEFKVYLQNLGIYSLRPKTVMEIIEKRIGFNF